MCSTQVYIISCLILILYSFSLDVILRSVAVESAQPGDLSEFIGTLIVMPDISQMATPGSRTLESKPIKRTEGYDTGVTGLKCLGVRDLTYRVAFLATNVETVNNKYTQSIDLRDGEELTYDSLMKSMSQDDIDRILRISRDPNLTSNLCSSLFPTIFGSDEVKRGLLLMLFGGVPKVSVLISFNDLLVIVNKDHRRRYKITR